MSGLDKEFPGKVNAHIRDATTPEAAKACRELGFERHGLVLTSSSGAVLWKQPDHAVNIEDVRAEIRRRLGAA